MDLIKEGPGIIELYFKSALAVVDLIFKLCQEAIKNHSIEPLKNNFLKGIKYAFNHPWKKMDQDGTTYRRGSKISCSKYITGNYSRVR